MAGRTFEQAKGRRVLVVEDEFLLAEELREELQDHGVEVVGPVGSVAAALALVDGGEPLDAATLDVTLGREKSYPVAEALATRGVPFVLVSGYDDQTLPEAMRRHPICRKPIRIAQVLALLFP